MKHALHHYIWLLLRFRGAFALYSALWVAAAFVAWGTAWGMHTDDYSLITHWLLMGVGGLIWLRAVQQDPVDGTTGFWRTRPVRWRSLWCSQIGFLLTVVAGPPLASWLLNGMLLENSAAQWRAGLWDAALILCPLVAVAGAASFARGGYGLVVALFMGAAAWMFGFGAVLKYGPVPARELGPDLPGNLTVLHVLLPAVCFAVAWACGLKDGSKATRRQALAAALTLGPLALSFLLPRHVSEPPAALTIHPAELEQPGAHNIGELQLRGVPPGQWPLVRESTLRIFNGDNAPAIRVGMDGKSLAGSLPVAAFASLLPPETRWYHSFQERRPWTITLEKDNAGRWRDLRGVIRGSFIAPEILASVPLAVGAATADNGVRFRIRGLHVSEQSLSLAADVFLAASLGQTLTSRNPAASFGLPEELFPVIHFPGAGFAIAATVSGRRELYRTWQTDALSVDINAAVPLAESLLGKTFTPATLRGARLLLCHMRAASAFSAELTAASMEARNHEGYGNRPEHGKEDRKSVQEIFSAH